MAIPAIFKDARLGVLSAGNFVIGTSLYIVGGLLVELAAEFQVSIAKAGFLIAAFALTSVIAAPVFATLSARIDRRKLLTLMLLICALANGLACFAQTYEQLLATRVLAAISSAVFTPQAAAILGLLVAPAQRNQATSAILLGWSAATVLGVPLGVWIGHLAGWRVTMGLVGLVALICAGALWWLLPAKLFVPAINLRSWLTVLRTPALTLVLATTTLFGAGSHAVYSYYAPLIANLRPDDPGLLATLLLIFGAAAVTSNLIAVLLMERLGVEKLVRIFGLLTLAALLLWPLLAQYLMALFVLQFLWGVGAGGFNGLQQSRLAAIAPALVSASIALNSSSFYIGQSFGTVLGGALWQLIDPRQLPWVGAALVIAAMLLSRKGRHAASRLRVESLPVVPTP